jgi:outer membrane autotransporter protein
LDLTGENVYQGGTVLNAGTLTVHSGQALGLGNVTVNGGILRADPQPINVKGNYTQTAGTLQLQVAGANSGQYDSLKVGGNAALGGTLQLISLGFHPKAGDQLTLVSTGGVVSGHFAQFVDPFTAGPGLALGGLVYGPNSVVLEFQSAAAFALTPNQRAAARLLDAVQMDPRAAKLISFFNQESLENLPGDFEKISPDGLTAFYEISFSNANIQRLNLEDRLDEVRNGSHGFSSNMKVNGATVNLENRVDADGKSAKNVVEPVLQHAPENRWGVWVTGFGDFVSVDADGNANGYNFTTGGVSLGLDYRITDQLAIGVMGEYSHTWTGLNPSGHIDVDSGRGGLYATWFAHGMYLNAAVYGGYNSYDSNRSGLGGLASGNTQGAEWSTFVSGGYDFHFAQLTVGPIAALQYTSVNVDNFSENGSLAPLAIHEGSAESLRSDVGLRAFYQWQIGQMVIEPSVKATWEHEYKYSALPITAGFAQIPGPSATFFGPNEGHDSAVISAGVNVQLTPAISTYVNYDGQLGRDHYDSNAVTGGVRFKF